MAATQILQTPLVACKGTLSASTSSFLGKSSASASLISFPLRQTCRREFSVTICGKPEEKRPEDNAARQTGRGRRQLILGTGITGLASILCPVCGERNSAKAADWTYGDLSGPNEWGDLCKTGTKQSPIDIPVNGPLTADNSLGSIQFKYASANASYLNTGHGTMEVRFPSGSNKVEINGRKLELLQFHFHTPSEHSFNGVRTAMEGHLVHRDEEGKLAVIGVMIEGTPKAVRNLPLEAALAFGPREKGAEIGAPVECYEVTSEEEKIKTKLCLKIEINPASLLPLPDRPDGTHSYVHYKGSLTTPPCSEGVDWFVLSAPLKVPDAQVVEFMRYVGNRTTLALNSRPRQDLGDRPVYVGPSA